MLAEHVPPPSRKAFLAALADVLTPARAATDAPPSAPAEPAAAQPIPARRPRSIDADVLAQAERLLTLRIGPVAPSRAPGDQERSERARADREPRGPHRRSGEPAGVSHAGRAAHVALRIFRAPWLGAERRDPVGHSPSTRALRGLREGVINVPCSGASVSDPAERERPGRRARRALARRPDLGGRPKSRSARRCSA